MSKQRFVKLNLGPGGGKPLRRSATLGGRVVADYVSAEDNQRYVVIECATSAATKPARKLKSEYPLGHRKNPMPEEGKPNA